MGMGDGFIEDFQISVSSEDPEYRSSAARPGEVGWCSDVNDFNPYFQVGFETYILYAINETSLRRLYIYK